MLQVLLGTAQCIGAHTSTTRYQATSVWLLLAAAYVECCAAIVYMFESGTDYRHIMP